MKIIINSSDENKEIKIKIPGRLIFNSVTAAVAPKLISKEEGPEFTLTGKQLRLLVREINRFRRKHKDWVLVEVEDGETGERVVIKL